MPDPHELVTTLYYTFSTIAQSLAGAVGLLAAFVVLHLSQLNQRLQAEADLCKLSVGPNPAVQQRAITLCNTGQMAEFWALCRENYQVVDASIRDSRLPWAETLLRERGLILDRLRRALMITAGAIVMSVAALSATPWIARHPCIAVSALVAGVSLVLLSVVLYVNVLRTLFGR